MDDHDHIPKLLHLLAEMFMISCLTNSAWIPCLDEIPCPTLAQLSCSPFIHSLTPLCSIRIIQVRVWQCCFTDITLSSLCIHPLATIAPQLQKTHHSDHSSNICMSILLSLKMYINSLDRNMRLSIKAVLEVQLCE